MLDFMGRPYKILHPQFNVQVADESTEFAPLQEMHAAQLLIMRYLIEGRYIETQGNFMTYREMPWGAVYMSTFDGRCIKRLAIHLWGEARAA